MSTSRTNSVRFAPRSLASAASASLVTVGRRILETSASSFPNGLRPGRRESMDRVVIGQNSPPKKSPGPPWLTGARGERPRCAPTQHREPDRRRERCGRQTRSAVRWGAAVMWLAGALTGCAPSEVDLRAELTAARVELGALEAAPLQRRHWAEEQAVSLRAMPNASRMILDQYVADEPKLRAAEAQARAGVLLRIERARRNLCSLYGQECEP